MFLSSLFSCAQKAEYKIIHNEPMFYEFNLKRDKVFIYDHAYNLSVYDVNTGKTTLIKADVIAEVSRNIRNPFIRTVDGRLLFTTLSDLCEIKDNKLIPRAKFVYKEEKEAELKKLNELVSEYEDNNIISYKRHFDVYVLNYADGHAVVIYGIRLVGINPLEKENIEKIKRLAKPVENAIDTTYSIEIKKRGKVINYFENKKLSIEEKSYSCKREGVMSLVSQCKYKIKIKYNSKAVTLKNEHRETRFSFWKDNNLDVDLNSHIPYSQYITDNKGNIYLIFDIEGESKLIKIPVNQFE